MNMDAQDQLDVLMRAADDAKQETWCALLRLRFRVFAPSGQNFVRVHVLFGVLDFSVGW